MAENNTTQDGSVRHPPRPCPTCARKPVMLVSSLKLHDFGTGQWRKLRKGFFVRCEKCFLKHEWQLTEADAAAAWNRRAGDAK